MRSRYAPRRLKSSIYAVNAYLVDVLQRVGEHPASDAIALTPRVWKGRFADTPLRSVLARPG